MLAQRGTQLGHLAPPYRGIDVEELYHDLFTFQLEMVHFSSLSHTLGKCCVLPHE